MFRHAPMHGTYMRIVHFDLETFNYSVRNWLQKSARNERTIQIRAIDPPFAATVSVRSAPETNESTLFRVSERFLTFRSRSTNPFSATVSARSRSRNQRNDQLRTLLPSSTITPLTLTKQTSLCRVIVVLHGAEFLVIPCVVV